MFAGRQVRKWLLARGRPLVFVLLVGVACASTPSVTREAIEAEIDLSGHWNDTDSRQVAEAMIRDAVSDSWAEEYASRHGRAPTVIVGQVRNMSHEHLNTRTFVKDLEREWVDSGRVRLVADGGARSALREERGDQARHARLDTAKSMGGETGADFMLLGQIDSILDSAGTQTVRYYQVELELIEVETNEKVWIGQKKLKKLVSRRSLRF